MKMLARVAALRKKKEEEEKDRLDMNPHGFWGTLENLIGRERKRCATKSNFSDGMGKFMLALPALNSGRPRFVSTEFCKKVFFVWQTNKLPDVSTCSQINKITVTTKHTIRYIFLPHNKTHYSLTHKNHSL